MCKKELDVKFLHVSLWLQFENSGDKEAWEMGEKVTHKDTIQIWYKAIKELEDGNIDACLTNFEQIIDTSAKIYFNVGALWFRKRNYSKAVTVRQILLLWSKPATCRSWASSELFNVLETIYV